MEVPETVSAIAVVCVVVVMIVGNRKGDQQLKRDIECRDAAGKKANGDCLFHTLRERLGIEPSHPCVTWTQTVLKTAGATSAPSVPTALRRD